MNEWLINPDDWYLLPPFIGSASLHMATIDEDGAAAMGFHLNPKILNLDPYSGDFGIGFFGHVQLQASYYVRHPVHGPLCFLCDSSDSDGGGAATQRSTAIVITPRDSVRRKVFVEPFGVMVEVAAGVLVSAEVDDSARTISVTLSASDGLSSKFRVLVSTPSVHREGQTQGVHLVTDGAAKVRGGFEFPLTTTKVTFAVGKSNTAAADQATDAIPAAARRGIPGNARAREQLSAAGSTRNAAAAAAAAVTTTATRSTTFEVSSRKGGRGLDCNATYQLPVPDAGHPGMNLVGSPDLAGFEGGVPSASTAACASLCLRQKDSSGNRLACNAWTFAAKGRHKSNSGWCWILQGRGNALGKCGYTSAYCDNRPSPPSLWSCCVGGWSCPNPINATV